MLSLLVAAYAMSGSVAAQDTYELTFSTYLPPTYEYVWKPIEDFVAQIEEESDGRVKINVFHSAQLFDGYDELLALSRGDVDLVNLTTTYPSGTVPELSIFTLPFLFDDVEHLTTTLDNGLFDLGINEKLQEEHNAVVLGVAPWVPYEFYSRRNPINTSEDIEGLVWASTGAINAEAIQALGGSPTSLASSELYLAFDRGVIDATPRPCLRAWAETFMRWPNISPWSTLGWMSHYLPSTRIPGTICRQIFRRSSKRLRSSVTKHSRSS